MEVFTTIASAPAKKYLDNNGIAITADDVAVNTMTKDRKALCPGYVCAEYGSS